MMINVNYSTGSMPLSTNTNTKAIKGEKKPSLEIQDKFQVSANTDVESSFRAGGFSKTTAEMTKKGKLSSLGSIESVGDSAKSRGFTVTGAIGATLSRLATCIASAAEGIMTGGTKGHISRTNYADIYFDFNLSPNKVKS